MNSILESMDILWFSIYKFFDQLRSLLVRELLAKYRMTQPFQLQVKFDILISSVLLFVN